MAREHIQVLRKMLQSDRGVILPGAPNALAARTGASVVQLEDQRAPKRCGHFDGKELIVADELVSKIKRPSIRDGRTSS